MAEPSLYPFQLLDVRLYEITIKRDSAVGSNEVEPGDRVQPYLAFGMRIEKHENRLGSVFLNIEIKSPSEENAKLTLDFTLEGLFETLVDYDEIDEKIWEEFQEQSSISLLWPYAREYTNEFNNRMRESLPLLPTFNRLSFNVTTSEETNNILEEG